MRHRNQPYGGLWTSHLEEGPSSAFSRFVAQEELVRWQRCGWWHLEPDPSAPVLVIASEADYADIFERFPHRDGLNLDFAAVARAGFAAVHLTERGASVPEMRAWIHESTIWLRWAFVGAPMQLDPPHGFALDTPLVLPNAPAPTAGTTRRTVGGRGVPAGLWVDVRPGFSSAAIEGLRGIRQECAAVIEGKALAPNLAALLASVAALYVGYPDDGMRHEAFLADLVDVIAVDDRVAALGDVEGVPYPVGPGLGARLLERGPALLRAVGTAVMTEQ